MSDTITCEWCAEEIPAGSPRCPKCQGSISPAGRRIQGTPLAPKPATTEPRPKAPAGWYDDPSMVNTRRYWDGQRWTEHRAEVPPPPVTRTSSAPAPVEAKVYSSPLGGGTTTDKNAVALYHWGILAAILLPILGMVMGIVLLGKKANWGLRLIVGSIGASILYYRLFFSGGA